MQVVLSFVRIICALTAQALFSCIEPSAQAAEVFKPSEWPVPAGDAGARRFSPLTDINRSNVAQLKVAWTYRHGDYRSGWPDPFKGTAFQSSPIVVDNRLVFSTPFNRGSRLIRRLGANCGHSIRRSTNHAASPI